MRGVFAFVALNLLWFDFEFVEFVIKQDTCTRPWLTINEGDIFTREIFDPFNLLWVTFGNNESLLADDEIHYNGLREQFLLLEIGKIVCSRGWIEQMGADDVGFTALQRHEPAK